MTMLATISAHDLGFIDTNHLIERLDATLTTVDRLEHFDGHLLNWYDTQTLAPLLPKYVSTVDSGNYAGALLTVAVTLREIARAQGDADQGRAAAAQLESLAARAGAYFDEMHFGFLYDTRRHLFAIGYRLGDQFGGARLDASYYDLLASEARLASFIAIAKGDVPESHWFHLGRLITSVRGTPVLLSWSATMFEYLMPLLLMRSYPETLLDETCRMAVRRQIDYGVTRATPWGIFRQLTVAHLRPYMELGILLGTIYLLQVYDLIAVMTGGGPGSTNLPYFVYQKSIGGGWEFGAASSFSIVVVIASIIVATVALRVLSGLLKGEEIA